ncbi:MAG: plastocyanin/azurin family copper-binding protein [Acidimicrobiia bacterium]
MTTDLEDRSSSEPNEAALDAEFHAPAQRPATQWEIVRDRLLIPVLLPLVIVAMVVLFALNISRFFLASAKNEQPKTEATTEAVVGGQGKVTQELDKSVKQPGPVVIITILTVGALAGAAAYSASRRMRKGTSALIVGGVVAVVFVGGQIVWSAGQPPSTAAAKYEEPKGDPVATLTIDALPSNAFNATSFNTKAGINKIEYVGQGGNHTLVFASGVPGFELAVNGAGSTDSGKAELKAATVYEVYCTVPGHKAAGMDAKITVQ